MYPIFVSAHPPAAFCSGACSQPCTFSRFHNFSFPCPPSPACCCWEQPGEISSSTSAAELVPWAGFCPNSCLGDTIPILITQESVSCCSPDASLCVLHRWERGQRIKIIAVSSLGKAVTKDQGRASCCPSQSLAWAGDTAH